MVKGLLVSAALVAGGTLAVAAQAETLQTGRSAYMHSHYRSAHHHMMFGHRQHSMSYGVGSGTPRTTATGGNAGGYSSRN